jgi:micrococcal nuclease
MGLIRLLLGLFLPKRRPRRGSSRQGPAPGPWGTPSEPLRGAGGTAGGQILRGHAWVIDGDTIVIDRVHTRLAGIDAPELDHPYGQTARRALMALCRGQVVTAVTDGSLTHDRPVAHCTLEDGRDLSAEMVRAGLALDWRTFSGGRYRHLEPDGIRKKLWRVEARHRGQMPPAGRE